MRRWTWRSRAPQAGNTRLITGVTVTVIDSSGMGANMADPTGEHQRPRHKRDASRGDSLCG